MNVLSRPVIASRFFGEAIPIQKRAQIAK